MSRTFMDSYLRRGSAVLVVSGLMASTIQTSRAENVWRLQGTLGVNTGASDNLNGAPDDPPPDIPPRDAGAYSTIAPGLYALFESPRQIHELTADLETTLVLGARGNESLVTRAGWRGLFTPVRDVAVRTFAQWVHSFSSDNLLPELGGNTVVSLPTGFSQVSSLQGQAQMTWEFARRWRLLSYGGVRAFGGLSGDNLYGGIDGGGGAGIERVWERTAIGVQGGLTYTDFARPGITGADNQVLFRGHLTLRHDLSRSVNFVAFGGVASLFATGLPDSGKLRPIGQLSFGYDIADLGQVQLTAARDVVPNLFIARTVLTDSGLLSGVIPLPWLEDPGSRQPKLALSVTGGLSRSHAIDLEDSSMSTPWTTYRAGVALAYRPRFEVTFSLNYSYARQSGDPMIGTLFLPYERHLVSLNFLGRFPKQDQAPQELTQSRLLRVDDTVADDGERGQRTGR